MKNLKKTKMTSDIDIDKITLLSKGYPYAVFYFANHIEAGEPVVDGMLSAVWNDIFCCGMNCSFRILQMNL